MARGRSEKGGKSYSYIAEGAAVGDPGRHAESRMSRERASLWSVPGVQESKFARANYKLRCKC